MDTASPTIKLEIPYVYGAEVIRHRGRLAHRAYLPAASPLEVEIPSISQNDAPCAFVITKLAVRQEMDQVTDLLIQKRILSFNDKFWLPTAYRENGHTLTPEDLRNRISRDARYSYSYGVTPLSDVRRVVASEETERITAIRNCAADYLLIDEAVFQACGEPCFEVATFGIGFNHGSTVLFARTRYNPSVNRSRYFRADQREEAIAAAERIALSRGDTNSVPIIPIGDIEVVLPECVRRRPEIDGPEGDPFLNKLELITANLPDINGADLGEIMAMANEMSRSAA